MAKKLLLPCLVVGALLISSCGKPLSPQEAEECYRNAQIHESGASGKIDYKKAVALYERAANAGHREALAELKKFYSKDGNTKKLEYWTAREFDFEYQDAIDRVVEGMAENDANLAISIFGLVEMNLKGAPKGAKSSLEDGFKLVLQAKEFVEAGYEKEGVDIASVFAGRVDFYGSFMRGIAQCYFKGAGCPKDDAKAQEILLSVASKGDLQSVKILSEYYLQNGGGARAASLVLSQSEAYKRARKSLGIGNDWDRYPDELAKKLVAKQDFESAKKIFSIINDGATTRAIAKHYLDKKDWQTARELYCIMAYGMDGKDADIVAGLQAAAAEVLKANPDDSMAIYDLAYCHAPWWNGKTKDEAKFIELICRAAELGHKLAPDLIVNFTFQPSMGRYRNSANLIKYINALNKSYYNGSPYAEPALKNMMGNIPGVANDVYRTLADAEKFYDALIAESKKLSTASGKPDILSEMARTHMRNQWLASLKKAAVIDDDLLKRSIDRMRSQINGEINTRTVSANDALRNISETRKAVSKLDGTIANFEKYKNPDGSDDDFIEKNKKLALAFTEYLNASEKVANGMVADYNKSQKLSEYQSKQNRVDSAIKVTDSNIAAYISHIQKASTLDAQYKAAKKIKDEYLPEAKKHLAEYKKNVDEMVALGVGSKYSEAAYELVKARENKIAAQEKLCDGVIEKKESPGKAVEQGLNSIGNAIKNLF